VGRVTRYGLVIDMAKCIGCNVCLGACKDEFVGNEYPGYSKAQPETIYTYYKELPQEYSPDEANVPDVEYILGQKWMDIVKVEQGNYPWLRAAYMPTPCMQCEEAPCVAAATDGAAYKRDDGIVNIDPEKAVGQTQIAEACPYGVIYWNSDENLPQKCTMCAHLVDEGKNPKCVDTCPISGVLRFGDLDDPSSEVSQLVASGMAKPLHPEYGTMPNVFYMGQLTPTVAGHLMDSETKLDVEGASVMVTSLMADGSAMMESDYAGNFSVEDLTLGGVYMVRIDAAGYYPKIRLAYVNGEGYAHLDRIKLFPR
jgi:Fe-S-cluster-containing dehydrogenase component